MTLKLIRFIRGYVEFSGKGKFPERFINLTAKHGIVMWNAHPVKGGLEASMYISDYRRIRTTARKSRLKMKITRKHGMPFLVDRYKSRSGLIVGAIVGIIITVFLSNFIWSVKVVGTENISQTQLVSVLEKNGLKIGAYKKDLDVKAIERNMMLEIDKIGWMSINLMGNTVTVEVKEKAEKPEIDTSTAPCNIKAGKDGVVTKINARKGTAKVLKGSGVTKGDLLVSGITETKMNTLQYVRAQADVFANVISEKELSLNKEFDYYSITENKIERKRLNFLWADFPYTISFESYPESVFTDKSEVVVCNDIPLPIGIKTECETQITKNKSKIDKKTANQIFDNSLMLYEIFEKDESVVVERDFKLIENEDRYLCKGKYIFNENIAETVEFSVTE